MRKGHEVDIAEVRRFVREQYGFEAVPSLMCGEKDLNFRLQSDAGEYVLKLAAPSVRREELDFQIHAMERAAQHSLPVAIPHVIRAPSGDALVSFRPDGETRWAHLLSFIPGTVWAHCNPHTDSMLRELGSAVASLDLALAGFVHPEADRPLKWNLSKAAWIRKYLHLIEDGSRRQLVNRQLDEYETRVLPKLADFPRQVIYNDANDHNIVCSDSDLADRKVAGLIDFGDAVESPLVCDAAIACAYAMMAKPDPLGAACEVAAGFHAVSALTDAELELLFPLILTRLCVTVTNAAWQRELEPENGYLQVSASPAWELLETLSRIHPHLAHYRLRAACGFPAVPHASRVEAWLRLQAGEIGPVLEPDLRRCRKIFADWGVASPELANPSVYDDPAGLTARLHARIADAGAEVAIGGYNCARLSYGTEQFRVAENNRHESRTVHLGLDVFLDAGSPVRAPFDGEVHSFANNAARFDYGPCIILKHAVKDASGDLVFHTLYGHLSPDSLNGLSRGQTVKKGDIIGRLGGTDVNGGWPPHLHLQIITDMLGMQGDFPGACSPSQRPVWLSLSPDPNLIAGIPADFFPDQAMEATEILRLRRERIGYNLSLSYRKKLHIVRGYKQWLYDADGQAIPRLREQRAARRPRPSARGGSRAAASWHSEHQHSLSARAAGAVCRRLGREIPRASSSVLPGEQRQRGERAGAAARARPHPPERHDRGGRRLPRQYHGHHRHQPLQVRSQGRNGRAGLGPQGADAGHAIAGRSRQMMRHAGKRIRARHRRRSRRDCRLAAALPEPGASVRWKSPRGVGCLHLRRHRQLWRADRSAAGLPAGRLPSGSGRRRTLHLR